MSRAARGPITALCFLLALSAAWRAAAQQPDGGPENAGAAVDEGRIEERPFGQPMPGMRALSRSMATAQPATGLDAGQVRVLVLDGEQRPAAGARVVLSTLKGEGNSAETGAATDENGIHLFTGLGVGIGQSYLVRVPHQGAGYRSPPFHLPLEAGYQVVIHRPDTTRDARQLMAMSGRMALELLDEKLRASVTIQLVNTGKKTYLFPEQGLVIRLPEGHANIQSPPTMEDRRLVEREGEGLALMGSVLPGPSSFSWQFDLPVSGSRARLALRLPWPLMSFRVAALAVDDMRLGVRGAVSSGEQRYEGRKFLVAEVRRKPGDPNLHNITISISGIPGPGPLRWVALFLSIIALAAGVAVALRPVSSSRT